MVQLESKANNCLFKGDNSPVSVVQPGEAHSEHAQTECKCYRGKKLFPPDSVGREESGLYEILNRSQNIRGAMSHFYWWS